MPAAGGQVSSDLPRSLGRVLLWLRGQERRLRGSISFSASYWWLYIRLVAYCKSLVKERIYCHMKRSRKAKPGRWPQGRIYSHRIVLPLADDMMEQIESVLEPGQSRVDFIRQAIARELKRQRRTKRRNYVIAA